MKNAARNPDEEGDGDRERSRHMQMVRDPRDLRELTTDVLGLPLDAGVNDVSEAARPATGDGNLLSRRKREQAWERFNDPVERLAEEAFLYPMDPLPDPADDGFPTFEPALPPLPELHSTDMAFRKLLDAVDDLIESPAKPPAPELRLGEEPDALDLPPPPLPKRWD